MPITGGGGGGGGDVFTPLVSAYHLYRASATVVDSDFFGEIATLPGSEVLTYKAAFTGDDEYLEPHDGPLQQGRLVLHNLDRGNEGLIYDCAPGTRTIWLTDDVPGDWAVNDEITIRSQTCVTAGPNYYFDVDVSEVIPATAVWMWVWGLIRATGSNQRIYFHPYETWGEGKLYSMYVQAANMLNQCPIPIPLVSQRFCIMGDFGGGNTGDIFGCKSIGYWEEG